MLVPKRRRLNAAFDPYLTPPWGVEVFMGGLSTRRFFAFGLAAAGAVPLASRLRFSSANAVETPLRAVPIAPVVPKTFKAFGSVRIDNYDWLRNRNDPRVVSYLDAENAYANARLEPIKPLVDELAAELKTREAQEDASVPATYNGYVYQHRFSKGRNIHTSCAIRMPQGRRRKSYSMSARSRLSIRSNTSSAPGP